MMKPYLDEPWQPAGEVSFRYQFAGKWSVEPELLLSDGRRFRQWGVIPRIVYDVTRVGRSGVLYVAGGVGYAEELDKAIHYHSGGPAADAGIGLRVRAGRFVVSPELRLLRLSLGLGYQF